MRRLRGGSLDDRIARVDRHPLSHADVAAIVRRVGGALVAAGEAGLVHGRVTADNVLYDERGDPWLTDFWLGRVPDTGLAGPDGRALIALVQACLPTASASVADAIALGSASGDPGPIRELVSQLLTALGRRRADRSPRRRTRTRACERSTRRTPRTTSAAPR